MADIIQLLPDAVANQIAAGEVIQRPASVIKELIENAVDAGADQINVIIKDAGRTLIQVTDNGTGMSDTDARLSFERHATSKIRTANDLFEIRTKGFRGEALASIAAIAQVTLRTRQHHDEIGTEITINGSDLEHQVSASCACGSNFMVKNLFYNVPARRKFLKSNTAEFKHIINEFQRIVLCHPEIEFTLIHNDEDIYCLQKSNLKQRIIQVFGKGIIANLNPIESETNLTTISGFIGKPEFARKTTGEQFFFVNRRYMRHPYFHRAVMKAYEKIALPETYPGYFIFFDIDPSSIDVNIHPTKTEIKFENEQVIFQILQSSVREALGKSNVMPSIDFETEGVIDIPVLRRDTEIRAPHIEVNPAYNPFETNHSFSRKNIYQKEPAKIEGWEQLYSGFDKEIPGVNRSDNKSLFDEEGIEEEVKTVPEYLQLRNKYILTSVKSGLMVIDQRRAHERVLFEDFMHIIDNHLAISQRLLFPAKLELNAVDQEILIVLDEELKSLGFEIRQGENDDFFVDGIPAMLSHLNASNLVEKLIEDFKNRPVDVKEEIKEHLALLLSQSTAINYGVSLKPEEISDLFNHLFACRIPNYSPSGKIVVSIISYQDFEKLLK